MDTVPGLLLLRHLRGGREKIDARVGEKLKLDTFRLRC